MKKRRKERPKPLTRTRSFRAWRKRWYSETDLDLRLSLLHILVQPRDCFFWGSQKLYLRKRERSAFGIKRDIRGLEEKHFGDLTRIIPAGERQEFLKEQSLDVLRETMEVVAFLVGAADPFQYEMSKADGGKTDPRIISDKIAYVFCADRKKLLKTIILAAEQDVRPDIVLRFLEYLNKIYFEVSGELNTVLKSFLRNFYISLRWGAVPLAKREKKVKTLLAQALAKVGDHEFLKANLETEAIPFILGAYASYIGQNRYGDTSWLDSLLEPLEETEDASYEELVLTPEVVIQMIEREADRDGDYCYQFEVDKDATQILPNKGLLLAQTLFLLVLYKENCKAKAEQVQ